MQIEKQLQSFKLRYLAARVPEQEQMEREWQDVELLLGGQNSSRWFTSYNPAYAFLGVLVLMCVTITVFAEPGDALYSVKSFSQESIKAVVGTKQDQKKDVDKVPSHSQKAIVSPVVTSVATPTPTVVNSGNKTDVKGVSTKAEVHVFAPTDKPIPSQAEENPSEEKKEAAGEKREGASGNGEEHRNEQSDNNQEKENNGNGPIKQILNTGQNIVNGLL